MKPAALPLPALLPLLATLPVALVGCRTSTSGSELTREECVALVEHMEKLTSDDTGGLRDALHARRRGSLDGCLRNGTQSAYRCVMQAENAGDLGPCDSLFK